MCNILADHREAKKYNAPQGIQSALLGVDNEIFLSFTFYKYLDTSQ